MPRAKKTTKPSRKTKAPKLPHEMIDTKTEGLVPSEPLYCAPGKVSIFGKYSKIFFIILLVGLVATFVVNKGLFIAALVDGKPIFRWQLNSVLVSRFGKQTVESMISEMLIADAGRKSGATVSQAEVDGKVNELVKSLGEDVKIDDLLKYQGMTKEDFEGQIRLQLMVEKVLTRDLTITDTDIANYIATNSALLSATDEAGLKEEARQAIISKTVSEKLQPWFMELKDKAKVLRFL